MKSFKLEFLQRENDLNKILKDQKRNKFIVYFLFTSLWDDACTNLVSALKEKYQNSEEGVRLYVINSFTMPHSFVIFKTTKLPHLVMIRKDKVSTLDYLPMIYAKLHV